jgi:hypothetical protein
MLTDFGYTIYIFGFRSTNETPLYYTKIFYNLEILAHSQRQVQENKKYLIK